MLCRDKEKDIIKRKMKASKNAKINLKKAADKEKVCFIYYTSTSPHDFKQNCNMNVC